MSIDAAIGFRVKSGWATAVLLSGLAASPRISARSIVELSDPHTPDSRQPYHAGVGQAQTDEATVERLIRATERYAHRSIGEVIARYRASGHSLGGAAIVVGRDVDPERIANLHIRAHASEGRLFRTVVEAACKQCQVPSAVVLERNVYSMASQALAMSEDGLRRAVTELGKPLGGPWRADEKLAAAAAWHLLATTRSRKANQLVNS
jgi:hypothetical protein